MKYRNTYTVLFVILLFTGLLITTACSKSNDNNLEANEVIELLIANDWINQDITYTVGGQDVTSEYETNFQDIYISFLSDGSYSIVSSNLGTLSSGTWAINEAGNMVTIIDQYSNVIIITILSISETSLHIKFTFSMEGIVTIDIDIDVTLTPST